LTTAYQIEHRYFSGHLNKDVAFFHADSRSLIVADLLFNMPPTEQYSKAKRFLPLFGSSFTPFSTLHSYFVRSLGTDVP
jgi:hypothetical protein